MHTSTSTLNATLVAASCIYAAFPSPAYAQPGMGPTVNGSVAAAYTNGATHVSLAGSVGYRFNRAFGMGVQLTRTGMPYVLREEIYSNGRGDTTVVTYNNPTLEVLSFTTNVRIEIPTPSPRVLLYAVGGGGVAATTASYASTRVSTSGGSVGQTTIVESVRAVNSISSLAFTLAGGLSILTSDHFSIDLEGRSLYARGRAGGGIASLGIGTTFRF